MNPNFRPMLGQSIDDLSEVRFPVIATPKLDGIRCITTDLPAPDPMTCLPVCRSLKQVPNAHIRKEMGLWLPPGLDGELMLLTPGVGFANFHDIQSFVMSDIRLGKFEYHVFDLDFWDDPTRTYEVRVGLIHVAAQRWPEWCKPVQHHWCYSLDELHEFEHKSLSSGYEGICFRQPESPYKYGRSTAKQQWLIKVKRFKISDAVIIGMEEEMGNNNPQSRDALGYQVRSSHSANMVGKGRMGALLVRDVYTKVEHRVGTGFSASDRQTFWDNRSGFIGQGIQYKYQEHGVKDKPRIPSFVGMRDIRDMDADVQKELF